MHGSSRSRHRRSLSNVSATSLQSISSAGVGSTSSLDYNDKERPDGSSNNRKERKAERKAQRRARQELASTAHSEADEAESVAEHASVSDDLVPGLAQDASGEVSPKPADAPDSPGSGSGSMEAEAEMALAANAAAAAAAVAAASGREGHRRCESTSSSISGAAASIASAALTVVADGADVGSAASTSGSDSGTASGSGERHVLQLKLNNSQIGALMGRGGARIKALREGSGALVHVEPPATQASQGARESEADQRRVTIVGCKAEVARAHEILAPTLKTWKFEYTLTIAADEQAANDILNAVRGNHASSTRVATSNAAGESGNGVSANEGHHSARQHGGHRSARGQQQQSQHMGACGTQQQQFMQQQMLMQQHFQQLPGYWPGSMPTFHAMGHAPIPAQMVHAHMQSHPHPLMLPHPLGIPPIVAAMAPQSAPHGPSDATQRRRTRQQQEEERVRTAANGQPKAREKVGGRAVQPVSSSTSAGVTEMATVGTTMSFDDVPSLDESAPAAEPLPTPEPPAEAQVEKQGEVLTQSALDSSESAQTSLRTEVEAEGAEVTAAPSGPPSSAEDSCGPELGEPAHSEENAATDQQENLDTTEQHPTPPPKDELAEAEELQTEGSAESVSSDESNAAPGSSSSLPAAATWASRPGLVPVLPAAALPTIAAGSMEWPSLDAAGPASRRSRRHASPSALKAVELAAVDLAVVEATRDSAEVEPATVDDAAVHVDTTEKVIASCAAVVEQTKVPELPALDRRNSNDADLSDLPQELICPITMNLMRDPVFTCDGQTYERRAIEEWLTTHQTSPLTGAVLSSSTLTPNVTLRSYIDRLVAERKLAASAASP